MSAYRTAIDQTARTIERRATHFRNQVVIVVTIGVVVLVAAFITRSATVLWAWLLVVPACGLFFYADRRVLNEWRTELLTPWVARELDFAAFRQAIRANPALPKGTTEGMLMTLPSAGDLVAEQMVLAPTRQAIAAASLALHRRKADALLINAVASGIVVGILLTALWMRAWIPLVGLALVVLLPPVRGWAGRWRQARCEAEVAAARARVGFSDSDYARARVGLL